MNGYAKDVLVTTDWLAEHLGSPGLVVAELDEWPDLYEQGHIQGAVKLHCRRDLRHPLIRDVLDRGALERLLGGLGIDRDTVVVLYGDKSNWFAAFGYWCLKLYGHPDVRLLDGGRQKWIDDGRALTTKTPSPVHVQYAAGECHPGIRAHRDEVLTKLGSNAVAFVDTRSVLEYEGELVSPPGYEHEGAACAGHIPGARSIPWSTAVNDDGTFKCAGDLAEIYQREHVTADKEVIAYCRIGERSAHTWFMLHELLGYPAVKNYDGSWTEWGNLVGVPIER